MRGNGILAGIVLALCITAFCRAEVTNGDLAKENAELRQRVEKLEKELAELKAIVMGKGGEQKTAGQTEAQPAAAPKLSEEDYKRIVEMVTKESAPRKNFVWSDLDVQLYGYIKLDAAYDTSRIDTGNYAKWVESEKDNKNDDQFSMTANQTRLGLKINGPKDDTIKTSGLVETDFYGGDAENKPHLMMRHAYMKIDWPDDRFDIIAGQTSDTISPLYPDTLNYTVCWWTGNIGYRRPQVRLTKVFALSSDIDLKLEGALARTIGISNGFTPDSGRDAGFPGIQSRLSLTFPWLSYKPTTVGISGHWAKEELDTSASGDHDNFDSWSNNIDLTQPINKWLTIKGEAFIGENLKAYLGGIDQGINTTTREEVGSKGGWIAAELGPWDKWRFNIGTAIDDVDRDDINADGRALNRSVFGNAIYSVNKNTEIGLELSQWHTEYKGQRDADAMRAQTSFIYKF